MTHAEFSKLSALDQNAYLVQLIRDSEVSRVLPAHRTEVACQVCGRKNDGNAELCWWCGNNPR